MFKINQSTTFKWPVKVEIAKDGGGFEKATFDVVLKRMTRSENEAIGQAVFNGTMTGVDAVKQITCGWDGVTDDGSPVEFSATNLDRLLEVPGVAVAIFKAFTEAHSGGLAAKN